VLRELGFDASARVLRIAEHWEQALGPELARHCRPETLRGEVLEASVASSVWCQQLQLRAPEILAGLRRVLGDEAPAKLRLSVRAKSDDPL
jgi:predicted nucleic acid-binding Zn ribbon protein